MATLKTTIILNLLLLISGYSYSNSTVVSLYDFTTTINLPSVKIDVGIKNNPSLIYQYSQTLYIMTRKGNDPTNEVSYNRYVIYKKDLNVPFSHQLVVDQLDLYGGTACGFKIENSTDTLESIVMTGPDGSLFVCTVQRTVLGQPLFYINSCKDVPLRSASIGNVYTSVDYENDRIYIAGLYRNPTYFTNNSFMAYFDLNLNYTVWVKYTDGNYNMNIEELIYYPDQEVVVMISDYDHQTFFRGNVYEKGDYYPENGLNNILIINYDSNEGKIIWTRLIGHGAYDDDFVAATIYGGELITLYNTYTGYYSGDPGMTKDIVLNRINMEIGEISSTIYIGGLNDTEGYNVFANVQGIFVLMNFYSCIFPHPTISTCWAVMNGTTPSNFVNFFYQASYQFSGVMFFSWNDDAVDLESFQLESGYDLATMYGFLDPSTYFNVFIYAASQANQDTGLYFTLSTAGPSFDRTGGTSGLCNKYSTLNSSICLQCVSPNYLYKHKCYATCPTSSTVISYGASSYCIPCHYACTACATSKIYNRAACDSCNSVSGFATSSLGCLCQINFNEFNARCTSSTNFQTKCPPKYNVFDYDRICKYQCSPDTYQYFDYLTQDLSSLAKTTSGYDAGSDCTRDMNSMHFSSGQPGLTVPATSNHSTLAETEFSMSFWLFLESQIPSSTTYTTFVAAFDQISISQKNTAPSYLTMTLHMSSPQSLTALTTQTYCTGSTSCLIENTWIYVAVAKKVSSNIISAYLIASLASQNSLPTPHLMPTGSGANVQSSFNPFQPYIVLGDYWTSSPSQSSSFTGLLKDFKIFSIYMNYEYMFSNRFRRNFDYSADQPYLIAYWKLNEAITPTTTTLDLQDSSILQLSTTITQGTDPQIIDSTVTAYGGQLGLANLRTGLTLCLMQDLFTCLGRGDYYRSIIVPHGRWLDNLAGYSSTKYFDITTAQASTPSPNLFSFLDQDQLTIRKYSCINPDIEVTKTYTTGSSSFIYTASQPQFYDLTPGHYEICFNHFGGETIHLGGVYVQQLARSVTPSNWANFKPITSGNSPLIIETDLGDFGNGDAITLDSNCTYGSLTNNISSLRSDRSNGRWTPLPASVAGTYYFCYIPQYDTTMQQTIPWAQWTVQGTPQVSKALWIAEITSNFSLLSSSLDIGHYLVGGAYHDGDQIFITPATNCSSAYYVGTITYKYGSWERIFFGWRTGTVSLSSLGFRTATQLYGLNMCYKPVSTPYSTGVDLSPTLVLYNDNTLFVMYVITSTDIVGTQSLNPSVPYPSLTTFYPAYKNYGMMPTETPYLQFDIFPFPDQGNIVIDLLHYSSSVGAYDVTAQTTRTSTITLTNAGQNVASSGPVLCQNDLTCVIQSQTWLAGNVYKITFASNNFKRLHPGNNILYYFLVFNPGVPTFSYQISIIDFDISTSQANTVIYPGARDVWIQGINIGSYTATTLNLGTSASEYWRTYAIQIRFYIINSTNSTCNYIYSSDQATALRPSGDVCEWTDSAFRIMDLNLYDCSDGVLMGNISIQRRQYDPSSVEPLYWSAFRTVYRDSFILGKIGCDPSCETCSGSDATSCIFCTNDNFVNFFGICQSTCTFGTYKLNTTLYNSKTFSYEWLVTCVVTCPTSYYPDHDLMCQTCPTNCQTCLSADVGNCTSCQTGFIIFEGICIPSCPSGYTADSTGTFCVQNIPTSSGLSVKIIEADFTQRVLWGSIVTLRAAITDGFSTVQSIVWHHIDDPSISSPYGDSIFTGSTTGLPYVQIDTSIFPSSYALPIHILVLVTNNETTVSDLYEFYINIAPLAGTFRLSPTAGSAITTAFTAYFENWDDTAYERTRYSLTYRIECELTDGSRILVLSPKTIPYSSTNSYNISGIYFPMISTTADMTVNVYLIAQDTFGAENYTVYQLPIKRPTALSTSVTEADKLNAYMALIKNVSTVTDLTSLLLLTTTTQQIYNSFSLDSQSQIVCLNDFQCFDHGSCITRDTFSYCACSDGYSGRNCQFPSALIDLLNLTNTNALYWLSSYVQTFSNSEFISQLQVVSQSLKYICSQGKISNMSVTAAMNILSVFTRLSVDEAIKIPSDIRESFIESMSSVYEMYFYHTNFENSVPDSILYPGLSYTRREQIKAVRNATRLSVITKLMNLTEKITDILVGTSQPTLNPMIVDTKIFRMTLAANVVSYFKSNNITSSPKEYGTFLQIPSTAFRVGVNIPYENVEVRLKIIQYYENPYQFYSNLKSAETDIVQIDFLDAYSKKISITNTPDPIDIYLPWSDYHQAALSKEMIDCVWWDQNYVEKSNVTTYVTINSSNYNVTYLYATFKFIPSSSEPWRLFSVPNVTFYYSNQPNYNSSGCTFIGETDTHTICRCNHLTTFSSIYNQPVAVPWNKRVSDFYISPVSIPWYDTLGFYFLLSLTCLFMVLVIVCWFTEIQTLQNKIKRLFLAKAKIEKILYNKIMEPEDLLAESYKPKVENDPEEVNRGRVQGRILLGKEIEGGKSKRSIGRSDKEDTKSRVKSVRDEDEISEIDDKSNFTKKSKKSKKPQIEDDATSQISDKTKKDDDQDDNKSAMTVNHESDIEKAIEAAKIASNAGRTKTPSQASNYGEEQSQMSEGSEIGGSLRIIQKKDRNAPKDKDGAGYLFSKIKKKNKDDLLPPIKENLERPHNTKPSTGGDQTAIIIDNQQVSMGIPLNPEIKPEKSVLNANNNTNIVEDIELDYKSTSSPTRSKRSVNRKSSRNQSLIKGQPPDAISTVSRATKLSRGLPVVKEDQEETHSVHDNTGMGDLNSSQEIFLKDENKSRGKISLNKLNKKENVNLFDQIDEIKMNDPDLHLLDDLQNYKFVDEVTDYNSYKKLKRIASRKAQEEILKMNFWQLYIRSTPLLNVWNLTSFLLPRYVRVTLVFINIYLQCLLIALFFTAFYEKPVLQTTAVVGGNLKGSDVGIVILTNMFTGFIMYTFFALFKVSDVRIRIARTIREVDNTVFELKREQKMKFFLAYFLTICTIGVTFWYVVTFSSTYGWSYSFEWLWTVFLAVFWDAFIYDPVIVLLQYITQSLFALGKTFAKIRSMKIVNPDY